MDINNYNINIMKDLILFVLFMIKKNLGIWFYFLILISAIIN